MTPLPQTGNPRPRIFRLEADGGVINRLGFNSEGEAAVLARLRGASGRGGIVGVNIGANKESPDRTADYVRLIETVGAGGELHHRQRLVAEHAGPARAAAGLGARRSAGRVVEARDRVRPSERADSAAPQDRARSDAEPISTTWWASRGCAGSTA